MLFDIKAGDKGKRTRSTGRAETLPIQQLGDNNENKNRQGNTKGRKEVVNRPHFKLLITSSSKAYSALTVTKHDKNALLMSFNELFLWAANFQFIQQCLSSIEHQEN